MKIIFICSGNTCRSPMAEGYLNSLGLPFISAESRGFLGSGDSAADNSIEVMSELGIDISAHRSRAISFEDTAVDRIICMTDEHRLVLISADVCPEKVSVLGVGIADPFGGDLSLYRKCRNQITDAVDALVFGGFFTNFTVRPAEEYDISAIASLEEECFSSPWSENSLKESMAASTRFFVAQNKKGEILGYGGVSVICDEAYITNIAVTSESRRKGIGTYLVARIISEARLSAAFVSLEVRVSNKTAIRLYEKLGFKQEGRRKNFYISPTEDALIMTKRF